MAKKKDESNFRYFFFRIPREKATFLDELQIPKTTFILQACQYFIQHMPDKYKSLYFQEIDNIINDNKEKLEEQPQSKTDSNNTAYIKPEPEVKTETDVEIEIKKEAEDDGSSF
ncbi:hypothetical protein DESAMIL20_683 [Desulfurella amilsii]|jgi:hypothetical protein|uniref:Uncharacterized protein n=1 Tax=Desulfurella amilsii TaxID=1562698 RepID=A0A1X4XY89_9BACT|nr:hypothetical protein [Desulfurella amilsii]OSS42499.1 hypothetical protein DESAMIL20_683 [Desulfurella amilsii]